MSQDGVKIQWISVEDAKPKPFVQVLGYGPEGLEIVFYDDVKDCWVNWSVWHLKPIIKYWAYVEDPADS